MSKKSIFLSVVVVLVAVSLVIYFNKVEVRATETVYTDEAQCLMETSQRLWEDRFRQAPLPSALYYIPDTASTASNQSFSRGVLAENNVLPVPSLEELKQRTIQTPPEVIYLHPDAVGHVDDSWLKQQYEAGIAIVALNTLVSELGTKLNVESSIVDLRAELTPDNPHFVLFYKRSVSGGASGEMVSADFLPNLDDLPLVLRPVIDTYHLTPEYLNALEDTCLK